MSPRDSTMSGEVAHLAQGLIRQRPSVLASELEEAYGDRAHELQLRPREGHMPNNSSQTWPGHPQNP